MATVKFMLRTLAMAGTLNTFSSVYRKLGVRSRTELARRLSPGEDMVDPISAVP